MAVLQTDIFKLILSLPTPEVASERLVNCFSEPSTMPFIQRINDLAMAFQELVVSTPTDAEKFSKAISLFSKAPGLPQVPDTWKMDGQSTSSLCNELRKSLYEELKTAWNDWESFDSDEGPNAILPSHPYLTGSLFSAALARYDLGICAESLWNISNGLRLQGSRSEPNRKGKKMQLLAIGACIQLVSAGSKLYSSGNDRSGDEVLAALNPKTQ